MSIKRRIYYSMLLLALITILITSFLIVRITYSQFYTHMQQQIRREALFIATGFEKGGLDFLIPLEKHADTNRVTWIADDGRVLYDNWADPETMDNHLNRPEIAQALEYGFGESAHISDTLGMQKFYYALLLDDNTVLRVSTATSSVYRSVFRLIPYVALLSVPVIILAMLIANLLTQKIINPINNLNLETPLSNETYDELSPLLSRMQVQNLEIDKQIQKLKNTKTEFNAITENIREGIIVLGSNGQILSMNKSAAAIFSVNQADHISKNILTLDRSLIFQEAVENALNGDTYENTIHKGRLTYHLLASPVKDPYRVKGAVLFIWDMTEKEAAERIRREFSANVSHELKTPLTSISGYAELMKSGMVNAGDIAVFAERIYNEARHLIHLIDNIMQISKLDEKSLKLPLENIDLLELAQKTVGRLSDLALKKGIELSVRGQNVYILGVRQMVEEIIYNLCDNAIKYNSHNGKVEVSIRKTPDNAILTVADNGFGIPKEQQKRVFERFYRVDKSHSRETDGTGLGLSIVKHSTEYLNAKIMLTSKPGEGTAIDVVFDIAKKPKGDV
ncbi:MAG: ATP-binding protein [Caldicoprobacterales bacterium]|jgi:two-component system phosphate regulon sensor histidine kinase PhoR